MHHHMKSFIGKVILLGTDVRSTFMEPNIEKSTVKSCQLQGVRIHSTDKYYEALIISIGIKLKAQAGMPRILCSLKSILHLKV